MVKIKSETTVIGRILKEWKVEKMGEVCSLEYGKGLIETQREGGKYPVFGSNGIVGYHSDFLVKGPGIVVGRKGTIGAVTWSDKHFWPIDTTYYIALKKPDTDLRWLFYKLSALNLAKLNMATGTPGLNRELAYKLQLSLPPLPEQKKIAEILMTADEVIQKVDEAIEKTERLKKGLMHELLTKGIGHKEFKDTEIGRIPKEWEVIKLNKLIEIKSGLYFEFSEFCQKGIKCLKIDNVGFGKIVWNSSTYLPESYLSKYSDFSLKKGDIVIALNRPIIDGKLKIGILGEKDIPSILYQRVGKFVFKAPDVNRNYIFYLFSGQDFKKLLSKSLVGTDQPYIRTPILLNLRIPLPPLPEQQKISEILSTVDKRLELLRERKEKFESVKRGLMNDLLTGKKRVKLEA